LESLVYKPLGLTQTSLPSGPAMPRPFIHGYNTFPPPTDDASTQLSAAYAWASGGLVSFRQLRRIYGDAVCLALS
jgi:D-alanyl-D-alanine carboxypeptidase